MLTKSFSAILMGFMIGVTFSLWLQRNSQIKTTEMITSTPIILPPSTKYEQLKSNLSSNFNINYDNIAQFYEGYYKFYELNREWQKKSFLGVHFLQNPNDAITIAEILQDQDIDLVIETGTYRGGAALFFASIMYQYRYNASSKTIRPFKIVTMDINAEAKTYINRYPLLASYITFIPHGSMTEIAKSIVNRTFIEMKPKNVFISLDGDHYSKSVYNELVYYQNYLSKIGNYILVQDTRLSSKWHTLYCAEAKLGGPCNGPQEGVNWFLKNEGQGRFVSDPGKEYLFSTHHNGWLKKTAS
ncbi:unnamed protein product [Adineta steineri]|uniref:Rhamnosyl O-methyltransferase n=1 Tax=Adineta steineri TaxID=433720 RepID=A0A814LSD7_9BILA|nr:unnamed protein product [Adineta steineri]CAF3902144.1 unnamed protein product [Adineta steineri]